MENFEETIGSNSNKGEMDSKQIIESINNANSELSVSKLSKFYLKLIIKWANILTISTLTLMVLVILLFFYSAGEEKVSLLGILWFIIPALYLNKFSNKLKIAIERDSNEEFECALKNLKSVFKFYGVFIGVILSLLLLALLAFIVGDVLK